jgi:beta-glucosidase
MFGNCDDRTAAELVAEALKIANQSDVIVAWRISRNEWGSSSRTNLEIPQAQKDLLQNY